ncbi:hypothetical protein BK004_04265 [bacterium CG10_46_32]|nr:MAG: hypothetical protein BK004_04265 [bacterium CG10_46_32]PIR55832.1 MAG: hypothetical protein COU73_04305 [Parcubacteria group bacterium CG10_big_fil_rev_8_21_14_0_10_46_32]
MIKYIWFTVILIGVVLALAFKQAPHEPEVTRPMQESFQDVVAVPDESTPAVSDSAEGATAEPLNTN